MASSSAATQTPVTPNESEYTKAELDALKFWSRYGRRGATPQRRIRPWDWDNLEDFSSRPQKAAWRVPIAAHQLPLLLMGFLPVEKDKSPFLTALKNGDYQPGDWMSNVGFLSTSTNAKNKATEDKWAVYADGPDAKGRAKLHMHRSWTGMKVIELVMQVGGDDDGTSACVTHIFWQGGAYPSIGDEEEEEMAAKREALTVCEWVLGVDLEAESGLESALKRLDMDLDQMAKVLHDATMRGPPISGVTTTRVG